MVEKDRSTSWAPFLFAFLAFGGVGGGLFLLEPFETSRHEESMADPLTPTSGHEAVVAARIWQDPFSAIERYRRAKKTEGDDNFEWPHKSKIEELIIIPVMVYGGYYSENIEDRRRRRYAILSAMAQAHYRPEDAENIGYFKCKPKDRNNPFFIPYEWIQHDNIHIHNDVTRNSSTPPVLLLWLNEQEFKDQPLAKINSLLYQLASNLTQENGVKDNCEIHAEIDEEKANSNTEEASVSVSLIGPAGSGLFAEMVKEAFALACNDKTKSTCLQSDNKKIRDNFENWKFSIFSPTATMDAKLILKQIEQEDDDGANNLDSRIEEIFREINIQFFRTIPSDRELAKKLVSDEFENRKIKLSEENVIVLISEWDTLYGRANLETFAREISRICAKKTCKEYIHRYMYMRGIDGEILPVDDNPITHKTTSNPSKDDNSGQKGQRDLERAVGTVRFDYLRRSSQSMKEEFSEKGKKVVAIGVLGSDVYDKLLVLQALRPNFPNALFFTTDVDARYLHPAERKWARNLVVVSGYDLKLRLILPEISNRKEHKPPPFRDSYQTSIYFATQLSKQCLLVKHQYYCSFQDGSSNISRRIDIKYFDITPKVFEVGHSRFVSLGEKKKLPESWKNFVEWKDFLESQKNFFHFLLLVFVFVVSVMMGHFKLPVRGALIVTSLLVFIPTIITYLIYCSDNTTGESLSLLSGTSSLPTIAILQFTLLFTICLIGKVNYELKKNADRLTNYFPDESEPKQNGKMWEKFWGFDLTVNWLKSQEAIRCKDVWRRYVEITGSYKSRCNWLKRVYAFFPGWHIIIIAVSSTLLIMGFVYIFDIPKPPIRGQTTLSAYYLSIGLALFVFLMLLFTIIDQMRLCRALARISIKPEFKWRDWPADSINKHMKEQFINPDYSYRNNDFFSRNLLMHILTKLTRAIQRVEYYPLIVLSMLLVAHSTLFDNWNASASVIVIIIAIVLFALTWGVLLHRAMKEARENAAESMEKLLLQKRVNADKKGESIKEAKIKQMETLIDDVERESRSTFRSLVGQPILWAFLLPSSGYGGLYLIEYFSR